MISNDKCKAGEVLEKVLEEVMAVLDVLIYTFRLSPMSITNKIKINQLKMCCPVYSVKKFFTRIKQ